MSRNILLILHLSLMCQRNHVDYDVHCGEMIFLVIKMLRMCTQSQ